MQTTEHCSDRRAITSHRSRPDSGQAPVCSDRRSGMLSRNDFFCGVLAGKFAMRISCAAIVLVCVLTGRTAEASATDTRLDIYFIDVEGGASTLFVTPTGKSLLVDS